MRKRSKLATLKFVLSNYVGVSEGADIRKVASEAFGFKGPKEIRDILCRILPLRRLFATENVFMAVIYDSRFGEHQKVKGFGLYPYTTFPSLAEVDQNILIAYLEQRIPDVQSRVKSLQSIELSAVQGLGLPPLAIDYIRRGQVVPVEILNPNRLKQ